MHPRASGSQLDRPVLQVLCAASWRTRHRRRVGFVMEHEDENEL